MKQIILILLAVVFYSSSLAQSNNRWFVTPQGTPQNTGTSWNTASNDLQDIINKANSGDEIWISRGTYKPIRLASSYTGPEHAADRDNAFVIDKGVKLYGGFRGGETSLNERSWYENKTILSGDLESNDDENNPASTSDNAYHVVIVMTTEIPAIDGFIISNGNADDGTNGTGSITVNTANINRSYGGGIYLESTNASLTNLIITANSASNGGGLYMGNQSSAILTNLFVVRNAATNGGGLFINSSDPIFTNVTIADNTAADGSEMRIINSSLPVIRNSIIWGSGELVVSSENGSLPSYSYSLVKNNSDNSNGNLSGTVDPIFINADSYFLSLISPLIDKGNNAYYQSGTPDLTGITTDITGRPRIHGDAVDIGAYEYQGSFTSVAPDVNGILYVNRNIGGEGGDGSSWTNALAKLCDALKGSEALNYVTPGTVKQIWVAKGTYYSIHKSAEVDSNGDFTTERDNAFSLVKDVKLYGGFNGTETGVEQRDWINNPSILSGDFNGNDDMSNPVTMKENAYHVVISAGEMGSALIDGFTITGGYADYNKFVIVNGIEMYSAGGAGLYVKSSSPIINNLIITKNASTYRGGGMLLVQSDSEITNLAIKENNAPNGGGIYIHQSEAKMVNIAVTNNSAISGGGMVSRESPFSITNMLIAGNTATNGGGLYNQNSSPYYTNVTIAGNNATSGSGMYNGGESRPVGRNSIIWGNGGSNSSVYSEPGSDIESSSYCLIEGQTQSDDNGNIAGDTDPLFISNGDYRLSPPSPLSNKGNNEYFDAGKYPDLSNIIFDLDGNPRIQHGYVDLGAYESDNTSNEADLQRLYINGVLHDINQTYIIPCDYARSIVDVELQIPSNASVNMDRVFTLDVSKPFLYKVSFTVTSLDGTRVNDYTLMVEKSFQLNKLVIQKWNNTLAINNNAATNGGHTFTACTWYKNGVAVSNKLYYSAGNSPSDLLNENDEFYLVLTKDNGDIMHTCPGNVTLKRAQTLIYPNPVRSGSQFYVQLKTEESVDLEHNGTAEIYSLNGSLLSKTKIQSTLTPLVIQGPPGVYIVRLKTEDTTESIKVIVQ